MAFDDLKKKLGANESAGEEGYPVTEETIKEWIEMSPEQKKERITEAKEKGGVWRESLLELNQKAEESLQEASADAAQSRKETLEKLSKDKVGPGQEAPFADKADIGGQDQKSALARAWDNIPGEAKVGAPAALAAGLGAVALAKKMRASKKAAKK